MKILAFSDVHGSEKTLRRLEKKAGKADVLICAGDFTNFEKNMRKVLQRLNSFGKKVMLVHGNHENPENVAGIAKRLKNLVFIHKKAHSEGDYVFVGHGGEGFALVSRDFERYAAKLKFKKNNRIVLVNHQPPYKTKLDYVWAHHGNRSYRKFILKMKPVLAVCGHLHETAGIEDNLGRTRLINPGDRGILIEI